MTYQNTQVYKTINLIGDPNGPTYIRSSVMSSYIFDIEYYFNSSYYLEIQNFELEADQPGGTAIRVSDSYQVIISDCIIETFDEDWNTGIQVTSSYDITIDNIDVSDCSINGIYMYSVTNSNKSQMGISNCDISNNDGIGITIERCQRLRTSECDITNNQGGIYLTSSQECSIETASVSSNTIEDNTYYGIRFDDTGVTQDMYKSTSNIIENYHIIDNNRNNIEIVNVDPSSSYNEMKNTYLDESDTGDRDNIWISNSADIYITGSDTMIRDAEYGILMENSDYVLIDLDTTDITTLADGNIYSNEWGIKGYNTDNIEIKEIHAKNNGDAGECPGHIFLDECDFFKIGGDSSNSNYIGLESSLQETLGISISGCINIGGTGYIRSIVMKDTQFPNGGIHLWNSDNIDIKEITSTYTGTDIPISLHNCCNIDIEDIKIEPSSNVNGIGISVDDCENVDISTTYNGEQNGYGLIKNYNHAGIAVLNCTGDGEVEITMIQFEGCLFRGLYVKNCLTDDSDTTTFAVTYTGSGDDDFKDMDLYAIHVEGSSLLLDDTDIDGYGDYAIYYKNGGGQDDHLKMLSTLYISSPDAGENKLCIEGTTSDSYVVDIGEECDGYYDEVGSNTYYRTSSL